MGAQFDILGLLRLALWPPTMLPGLDMLSGFEKWALMDCVFGRMLEWLRKREGRSEWLGFLCKFFTVCISAP